MEKSQIRCPDIVFPLFSVEFKKRNRPNDTWKCVGSLKAHLGYPHIQNGQFDTTSNYTILKKNHLLSCFSVAQYNHIAKRALMMGIRHKRHRGRILLHIFLPLNSGGAAIRCDGPRKNNQKNPPIFGFFFFFFPPFLGANLTFPPLQHTYPPLCYWAQYMQYTAVHPPPQKRHERRWWWHLWQKWEDTFFS